MLKCKLATGFLNIFSVSLFEEFFSRARHRIAIVSRGNHRALKLRFDQFTSAVGACGDDGHTGGEALQNGIGKRIFACGKNENVGRAVEAL